MASNTSLLEGNIIDMYTGVNTATNQGFALGIIIVVSLLIFAVFIKRRTPFNLILILYGASMTLITGLFVAIQWIHINYLMLPIVVLFLGIILNLFGGD